MFTFSKDRNLFSIRPVTKQVETLHLFYQRTKTYSRFNPSHLKGGNLTFIFSKDGNLFSIQSLSPNKWKPNLYFIKGQKPVLGQTPVTEQVETLPLFYLRTETYSWFNPCHRIGGDLIFILSNDRNLFSVQPRSPNRWKPKLYFI